jgi:stage IV sporulation protein FB
VYFGEPQRTNFDLNFSLLDVPVRVSPWFWLGTILLGYNGTHGDPKLLLIWIAAVFLSIVVHEMGHAIAIRHFGGRPWIVLLLLGGLAFDDRGRRTHFEQIVISAAGPLAEIALALLTILLVRVSGHQFPMEIPFWPAQFPDLVGIEQPMLRSLYLNVFIADLTWISIVWAVINLIPVFPLDGGQIARAALSWANPRDGLRQSLWLSVIAGGAMAWYGFSRREPYMGIMFGALAFDSFQTLKSFTGGGWR